MLSFITGPVRAGKSTLAERLATASGKVVVYCATASRDDKDPEWIMRIERHRAQRPPEWTLLETAGPRGADLIATLGDASAERCMLVESIGTWIADIIGRRAEALGNDAVALFDDASREAGRLIEAIVACRADVIVVSEEVGWGVVPAYPSGRVFRDIMGRTNQKLAAASGRAYLVVSGIPIDLKAAASIVQP